VSQLQQQLIYTLINPPVSSSAGLVTSLRFSAADEDDLKLQKGKGDCTTVLLLSL
jgi:hypothetical protein